MSGQCVSGMIPGRLVHHAPDGSKAPHEEMFYFIGVITVWGHCVFQEHFPSKWSKL